MTLTHSPTDTALRVREIARDVGESPDMPRGVKSLALAVEVLANSVIVLDAQVSEMTDLRSHEPPRNSGEGTAVDGPMPLAGGDESQTHEPE